MLIHRGRIVAVDAEGFYDITLFGFVHGESSCASAAAADASEHRGFGKAEILLPLGTTRSGRRLAVA